MIQGASVLVFPLGVYKRGKKYNLFGFKSTDFCYCPLSFFFPINKSTMAAKYFMLAVFVFVALSAWRMCLAAPTPTASDCQEPVDPGPCKALMPKFAYNQVTKMCEKFAYGGCMGNDNKFDTLIACQSVCESAPSAALPTSAVTSLMA